MACPTVSLDSVVNHFESLPDPRHTRNRHHLLVDVITIAVCGVIVGCEGPTAIVRWAKTKQEWLGQWLELPNGIPSRDCLRRVLSALKPEAFQECFQKWITECLIGTSEGSHRTIAIDGKTMRRSHDRAGGLGPLHLVSAWASEQGIALGQIATEEKSNEIMAIRITEKSDGTTSEDVRRFIVSRYLSGKRFAQSVRGHWAIENSLHWVLDVTFNEDQSRARERKLADNLSWLRRFGISLLKQHPSKESIKGKSQIAGWSNDFLMEVLVAQRT